jgi:hypothetical protein
MIAQMDASNVLEFCALVMQRMLLTLGGQVTMTIQDLSDVARDYPTMRVALDPNTNLITLTLISADGLYSK